MLMGKMWNTWLDNSTCEQDIDELHTEFESAV